MLRLIEVASQSETFSKRVLENHESKIFAGMAQPGHYRGVFSIDRPPLLAVRCGHYHLLSTIDREPLPCPVRAEQRCNQYHSRSLRIGNPIALVLPCSD